MEAFNVAEMKETRMESGRNVEWRPGVKKRAPGLGPDRVLAQHA